jgi:hypothetical protein
VDLQKRLRRPDEEFGNIAAILDWRVAISLKVHKGTFYELDHFATPSNEFSPNVTHFPALIAFDR